MNLVSIYLKLYFQFEKMLVLQFRTLSVLATESSAIDYERKKRSKIPINYSEFSQQKTVNYQQLILNLPQEIVLVVDGGDIENVELTERNNLITERVDLNGQYIVTNQNENDLHTDTDENNCDPEQFDAQTAEGNGHGSTSKQLSEIGVQNVVQIGTDFSGQTNEKDFAHEQHRDIDIPADVQSGSASKRLREIGVQTSVQSDKNVSSSKQLCEIGVQTDGIIGIDFSGRNGFGSMQLCEAGGELRATTSDQFTQTDGPLCFLKHEKDISAARVLIRNLTDRVGDELVESSDS